MRIKILAASAVVGAFVMSGPLQHFGVLPQTVVGDASKQAIKAVLNITSEPAFASCGGGGGRGHSSGNNGWGNGEDRAPGGSLAHQPKFEDPNTGPSPSHSPRSGGGDR